MRAYYENAYIHEFTAQVIERVEADGRPAVILGTTYFYPTGGGQPHDLGRIGGVEVVDVAVRKADHAVMHVLKAPLTSSNRVACIIDWHRRFDHMQNHTGQHILSQALVHVAHADTVGFHMSQDSLTIDLGQPEIDPHRLLAAEDLANSIIFENRAVTARIIDPDAPEADGVRARRVPEQRATDGLRVVEIAGFDRTACGGTHVAHTGEVGLIKIIKVDKRGDKLRVEFRCGGRALEDYRKRVGVTNGLAADLTCAFEESRDAVARLRDEVRTSARALREAEAALMAYERDALLSRAASVGPWRVVLAAFDERDAASLRALASMLCDTPGTIALLGSGGAKAAFILARSADIAIDMGALFKGLAAEDKGLRGGGQPALAQGGSGPLDRAGVAAVLERALAELPQA